MFVLETYDYSTVSIITLDAYIQGEIFWRLHGDCTQICWSKGSIRAKVWLGFISWAVIAFELPSNITSDSDNTTSVTWLYFLYQRDMCHQEIQHSSLSKILCLKPALIHPQKNTSWALCKRCCGLLNTLGQILHLLWIFYLSSFVIHQKHTGNPVCACWTSWESTSDLSLSLGGHADISGYSH